MHKTYWLTGKDGFDKELPDPVLSENNHGYMIILIWFNNQKLINFDYFRIDAQLIETIEKIRAERLEEERKNAELNKPEENPKETQAVATFIRSLEKKPSFRDISDELVKDIHHKVFSSSSRNLNDKNDSGFNEGNGQLAHADSNQKNFVDKRLKSKNKRNLTDVENV